MTTLIKIDRASIKKNPRAGNTSMFVPGMKEISFEYPFISEGDYNLLKQMENDRKGVIITTWVTLPKNNNYGPVTGICEFEEAIALLPKTGLKYSINNNNHRIDHLPEPKWLYSYLPTTVQCDDCNNDVLYSDIKTEYSDDDDYCEYTICPVCGEYDTFDYSFERISDVIKELKLK